MTDGQQVYMTAILDTWIPNPDGGQHLVTIDVSTVWLETFAHWDALVPTHVAEEIASATERALLKELQAQS